MKTFKEALHAMQAGLVIGGLQEALALQHGDETPLVERVVVVFEGESPDGASEAYGVLSVRADGTSLSESDTTSLLAKGSTAWNLHLLGDAAGAAEEEEGDG